MKNAKRLGLLLIEMFALGAYRAAPEALALGVQVCAAVAGKVVCGSIML